MTRRSSYTGSSPEVPAVPSRRSSARWAGRRPEGPAVDPAGKEAIKSRRVLSSSWVGLSDNDGILEPNAQPLHVWLADPTLIRDHGRDYCRQKKWASDLNLVRRDQMVSTMSAQDQVRFAS